MKKLLSGGLAAVIGAFIIAPFSASADTTTKQWSPEAWAQLFPVVDGQYLGSDLQYHDCEFRYYGGSAPVTLEDTISSGAVSMLGRNCVNYRAYLPNSNIPIQAFYDANALYDAKFIINFDFSFIDCSYCSIGFFGYIYPTWEFDVYYSAHPLLFNNAGSNQWDYGNNAIQSAINASGGMRGIAWTGASYQGLGGISTISQSPGSLHFGSLSIATVGSNIASDGSFFGVILPITNDDAQIIFGGDDSGDSTSVTGSLDGSITPDGSSGYDVNVNVNVNVPDYHNDINPSYDSSGMDEMKDMVDSVADAENSLLISADNDLSSLPGDLEWDEDLVEEAVGNPFETFFNENIIGVMVFWVCSIAFISYILFGKWV